MKIKVSEATNLQLDWLVASIKGVDAYDFDNQYARSGYRYSTDPALAQPLIEQKQIATLPPDGHRYGSWQAFLYRPSQHDLTFDDAVSHRQYGQTPLIAAMRCLIVSEMGLEAEIPEELE